MRPNPSRQGLFPHCRFSKRLSRASPSAAFSRSGKPPSLARPGGTIRRLFLPCKREAVSVFPTGRLRQSRHPSNGKKASYDWNPRHAPGRSARLTRSGKAASASAFPARPFCGGLPHRQTAVPFPRKAGPHHPAAGKRLCPGLFSALQNRPALLFVNFSESLLTLENRFYILCCAGISGGVCHRKIPSYLFTAGYSENNRADARHFSGGRQDFTTGVFCLFFCRRAFAGTEGAFGFFLRCVLFFPHRGNRIAYIVKQKG